MVGFFKRKIPVGPPPSKKLSKGFVMDELQSAGYTLSGDLDGFPYQYVLVFRPRGSADDGPTSRRPAPRAP